MATILELLKLYIVLARWLGAPLMMLFLLVNMLKSYCWISPGPAFFINLLIGIYYLAQLLLHPKTQQFITKTFAN